MAGRQSLASGAGMEGRSNSIGSSKGTSLGGTSRHRGHRPMKLPTIDMRVSRGLYPTTDVQRSGFCNGYEQSIASRRCAFMKIMGPNCDGVPGCCKPDLTNDKCGMNDGDCSFLKKNSQGDTPDEGPQDRKNEVIERRQSRRVSKAQSSFFESESCAPTQRNTIPRKCNLTRERAQTVECPPCECPPCKPGGESESESSSCVTCSSSNESDSQNDPVTSSSFRVTEPSTPQNYRSLNDLKSSSHGILARPRASGRIASYHSQPSQYSKGASSKTPKQIIFRRGTTDSPFSELSLSRSNLTVAAGAGVSGNSRLRNGDPSLMFIKEVDGYDMNSDSLSGDEVDGKGQVSKGAQVGPSQTSKFKSEMSHLQPPPNSYKSTGNKSSIFKESRQFQVDSSMLPGKSTVKSFHENNYPRDEYELPFSTFGGDQAIRASTKPSQYATSQYAMSTKPSQYATSQYAMSTKQSQYATSKTAMSTKPSQYATSPEKSQYATSQYAMSTKPSQYATSTKPSQYATSTKPSQYATSQHATSTKPSQYSPTQYSPSQYPMSTKPSQYDTSTQLRIDLENENKTHRAESCPSGVICATPGVNSRCQDINPDIQDMNSLLRQIHDDRHGAAAKIPQCIPQQLIDQLWGVTTE